MKDKLETIVTAIIGFGSFAAFVYIVLWAILSEV